jgi:hypothetical protein
MAITRKFFTQFLVLFITLLAFYYLISKFGTTLWLEIAGIIVGAAYIGVALLEGIEFKYVIWALIVATIVWFGGRSYLGI